MEIIDVIRQQHFKTYSKQMPRYAVDIKHLKKHTTSQSDVKKNKIRIPDKAFLIVELAPRPISPSSCSTDSDQEKITFSSEIIERDKTQSKTIYQRNASEIPVILTDFKLIRKIGRGGFGIVYLVQKTDDGKYYAMKQLRKDLLIKTEAVLYTKIEKEVLKLAHHPFLVGMSFVFQTPSNIYFVMKYYRGGELYGHLRKRHHFDENITRFYVAQIVLALGELHKNMVIYRDMKPENILLDTDGYVALADFGLAKIVEADQSSKTFCGTPDYIAPEIANGYGYNKNVDWWGIGILIYEMLFGKTPFYHKNQHIMFQNITKSAIRIPSEEETNIKVSSDAKDVIQKLLCKEPKNRLGAKDDMNEVLTHPFFKVLNIEKLLKKELTPPYIPPATRDLSSLPKESNIARIDKLDSSSEELIQKNKVSLLYKFIRHYSKTFYNQNSL